MISVKRCFVVLCMSVFTMVLMYSIFIIKMVDVNLNDFRTEKTKIIDKRSTLNNKKTIQWYDSLHNNHGLRNRAGIVNFDKCEYRNCKLLDYFKYNKSAEQHGPLEADAVVFQGNHIGYLTPPLRRDNDQVFVFAARESWLHLGLYDSLMSPPEPPKQIKEVELDWVSKTVPDIIINPQYYMNIVKFRNLFNWTMTYRRDSDIRMLYGKILRKTDVGKSNKRFILNQGTRKRSCASIYKRKRKDAVWLVSHCTTKSKRENYIAQLRKYINIDIFGACGKNLCPKHSRHSKCMDDIVNKYKFVLSFENTFHQDYVTEKLFDWFPKDIIPVVYGMADYNEIVPDGTIISASNFSSPERLANYMNYVGSNRDVYVEYLRRKRRYVAVGHDFMQQKAYCELCGWLHNIDAHRKSYPKIDKWWQLNDTSGYIKLYNQALPTNGYRQIILLFVLVLILVLIILFCQCVMCIFRILAPRHKNLKNGTRPK